MVERGRPPIYYSGARAVLSKMAGVTRTIPGVFETHLHPTIAGIVMFVLKGIQSAHDGIDPIESTVSIILFDFQLIDSIARHSRRSQNDKSQSNQMAESSHPLLIGLWAKKLSHPVFEISNPIAIHVLQKKDDMLARKR